MTRCFVDTFYYLALLNPRDEHHRRVIEFHAGLSGRTVTTDAVFLEVGNTLGATALRDKAAELIRAERASADVTVIPLGMQLLDSALNLYSSHSDKRWSLTDCVSFVVMKERDITDALTGDHHFAQAGFHALFAD